MQQNNDLYTYVKCDIGNRNYLQQNPQLIHITWDAFVFQFHVWADEKRRL